MSVMMVNVLIAAHILPAPMLFGMLVGGTYLATKIFASYVGAVEGAALAMSYKDTYGFTLVCAAALVVFRNLAEKKFLRQSFDYLTDKYNLLSDHIDKKRLRQDLMTQQMEREEEMVERKLLETANRKEIAERRALLKEHEKITRYYMHQNEPLTYTLIQIERALERAQIDLTFKKLHPAPQLFTPPGGGSPQNAL